MKQQYPRPTAILTGDWHLREDTPECRTDDFWKAQWEKVDWVADLQRQLNCPIFHSGDLFNKWHPSLYLVAQTIQHLPAQFYTVFGNHDLPQHNLELSHKCGINVLEKAGKLNVMNGEHWGAKTPTVFNSIAGRKILVWHVMTYTGKEPYPGCTDIKAPALLKKYPKFDLIHTGHNHKTFIAELDGRLLVNVGSLMRQTADQEDFEPCVFLYYAETNEVVRVPVPIKPDVISREHIDKVTNRNDRIDAFVGMLNSEWEGAISFEENLERLMSTNQILDSVKQIVYKALE